MTPRTVALASAALMAAGAACFLRTGDREVERTGTLQTAERWLGAGDFAADGSGALVSEVIEARIEFESFGLSWRADADAVVSHRVSLDGVRWGAWSEMVEDRHGSVGGAKRVGELQFLDEQARYLQVRVEGAVKSELEGVHAVFTQPAVVALPAPNLSRPRAASAENPVPKPDVVSRTDWGCPDGQGSRWTPVATDVDFLIVHHSAGSNSSNNWAATVQGIWSFHALTRGWGDIGYNFLIDPNGMIYEGRAGEDSIGAHFSCTNGGTMGVCVIGDFTSVEPTQAALDSLAWLLAWKADQKAIDPLALGFHGGTGLTLDKISGHRDGNPGTQGCASGTVCPGAMLYPLLPSVRTAVADLVETGSPFAPELGLAGFALDEEIRPGLGVGLSATLQHIGGGPARNITATLSSGSPYLTITDAQKNYRDLADGDSEDEFGDFDFAVAGDAPHGHVASLQLDVTADGGSWSFAIAPPPVVVPAEVTLASVTANPNELPAGSGATFSYQLESNRDMAAEFALSLVDAGGGEFALSPFTTNLIAGLQTKNRGSLLPAGISPGAYGLRVQIHEGEGQLLDQTFPNVITVLAPSFDDWAAANITDPADRAPGSDPDGDGIANLLEYALRFAPTAFDPYPLEFVWIEQGGERYPAVRFVQRAGLASEVVVEIDNGDGSWSVGSANVTAQVLPGALRRLVRSSSPESAEPRQLLRMRVNEAEL